MKKLVLKKGGAVKASTYKYDPWQNGISQSMLQTRMDCDEKARLYIILGLTPVGHSKPLTWGDLWHEVASLYFRALRAEKKPKAKGVEHFCDLTESWISEVEFAWADRQLIKPSFQEKDNVAAYLAEIQMLLPHYIRHWWKRDTECKWVLVEDKFNVSVDRLLPPLVGKFDRVAEEGTELVLHETKTKGQWSERLMDWLPLDLQLGTYLTALPQVLKRQAAKVSYDLIRRPQERRKVDESLRDFIARIEKRVEKEPEHYFERIRVELDKAELDMHLRRTKALVHSYMGWYAQASEIASERMLTYNSGMCESRYGACPFLAVCAHRDRSQLRVRSTPSPELI